MTKRSTVRDIGRRKEEGEPLVCLTAYTAPMARLADEYADILLVGDSVGMVLYGMESTLPVTLDMMIAHGKAVASHTEQAFVVLDMPFASYQESPELAFRNAARVMKETGCGAVKLEGGQEMAETVSFLVQRGVPVMGHIGLQPQSVNSVGGYRVTGKKDTEKNKIRADADSLVDAGVFAIVLECLDAELAAEITTKIPVPTIGIGASPACNGQILVTEDLLGISGKYIPLFVKKYADLGTQIRDAVAQYAEDVRKRKFPGQEHVYGRKNTDQLTSVK